MRRQASELLVVVCSENYAAATLTEACMTLQGPCEMLLSPTASTRATFEYAVRSLGVRAVLVCGHEGCRGAAAERSRFLARCAAVREDAQLGKLLREHDVTLEALWFAGGGRGIFRCRLDDDRIDRVTLADLVSVHAS